jgi:hypothetical protein
MMHSNGYEGRTQNHRAVILVEALRHWSKIKVNTFLFIWHSCKQRECFLCKHVTHYAQSAFVFVVRRAD